MFRQFSIALLTFMTLLIPYAVFSQEKITENVNVETSAAMMTRVNSIVADFGDRLKRTKIGDIPEISIPTSLKKVTLDEYIKYGTKTAKGTAIYVEKRGEVTVATVGERDIVETKAENKITEYLKNEFTNFYKTIAPILTDIAKGFKDSLFV